jgi:hypothetical protein
MRLALNPHARRPMLPTPRKSVPQTIAAPIRGLVTNTNLARAPGEAALVLDNWFPLATGIRLRGGTAKYATLGAACTAMWAYQSGSTQKLFAATAGGIFDITAVADINVPPTAAVGSLTGGAWTFVQFQTSGGDFLVGCNGTDTPQEYDGSAWSASTMTGLTTSLLSHVWAFKNRLFFIQSGSMNFWYLPVGSKTGALTSFSLAGVFARGGSLLFGATWSLDAGDGVDDLCVIVSTMGEVAVYQGSNPSDASAWSLVGRYEISKPLGKDATERAGGELLIATVEGIIPISEAITKDRAALSLTAVSAPIEPDWVKAVSERAGLPWTLQKFSERNMMLVGSPAPSALIDKAAFVVNIETGAWCRYTGEAFDIRGQTVLQGVHYTGTGAGIVYRTEVGGNDNGANYQCDYVGHFSQLGRGAAFKTANLMRGHFRASQAFVPKLSASVDYNVTLRPAPPSVANSTPDVWDSGIWDTAVWDSAGGVVQATSRWVGIVGAGHCLAPQVQVTCGVTPRPDAELLSIDVMFEPGAVVV